MKTSTIILSLLSTIGMVAATPINPPSQIVKVITLISAVHPSKTITTTSSSLVRRSFTHEPTHKSDLDCPYVCNIGCLFEGGCTPEAFSKYISEKAAASSSAWQSRVDEHFYSQTHVVAKPTADKDGMSISWKTSEPTVTGLGTVVRRDAPYEPTNIAEKDCDNVCNMACLRNGGCIEQAFSKYVSDKMAAASSAWQSRVSEHFYSQTHVVPKPTADENGMSISWRNSTATSPLTVDENGMPISWRSSQPTSAGQA